MASGYQLNTLRGFSEELDLRPLHFVDPLPPARVYSACGHVSKRMGGLPRGHFLCSFCYQQQCEADGGRTCPFDGEAFPEEAVQWRPFPAEELLKKQVNCWNKGNGCTATMAASELSRHFYRECENHSTSCPKCFTKVLCKSLCSHIRSCAGSQRPSSSEVNLRASNEQQCTGSTLAVLSTATLQIQQQMGELKAGLKLISLQELSRDVNKLGEMLKQGLEKIASENRDSFTRHTADIGLVKDIVVRTGKETSTKMESVLRHTMKRSSHEWILKGYASLKDEVRKKGSSESNSTPVYLCGYLLLFGIFIKKGDYPSLLSLHLQMCLGKGDIDEYLHWPFARKMVLAVVHPRNGYKREVKCEPNDAKYYSRPTTAWNQTCYFTKGVQCDDLDCGGYVKDDQLKLCVTLLE